MQAIDSSRRDRLGPTIHGQFGAAIALDLTVDDAAFGAQIFDHPGGIHGGGGLPFGFLAGAECGGNSLSEADEGDAENGNGDDDFDERETRVKSNG